MYQVLSKLKLPIPYDMLCREVIPYIAVSYECAFYLRAPSDDCIVETVYGFSYIAPVFKS